MDAMARQIKPTTLSMWHGGHVAYSGYGAVITCEKCNNSFELRFSFGEQKQATNATIAASKAYGWRISKKAVLCDNCFRVDSAL